MLIKSNQLIFRQKWNGHSDECVRLYLRAPKLRYEKKIVNEMEMKSKERQNQNAHCASARAYTVCAINLRRNFYLFSVSILLRFSCTEINKCTHTHSGYRSKCDLRAMASERVRVCGNKPKKMEKKSKIVAGRSANHKNWRIIKEITRYWG